MLVPSGITSKARLFDAAFNATNLTNKVFSWATTGNTLGIGAQAAALGATPHVQR